MHCTVIAIETPSEGVSVGNHVFDQFQWFQLYRLGYCSRVRSTSWIYNQINGGSANGDAFID